MRKYYCAGKIGGPKSGKLCITFGRFFIDIFRLISSFGLRLFVELDIDHIHHMERGVAPGKSIRKSSMVVKISGKLQNGRWRPELDPKSAPVDPKSRADAQ